jgi:hypothetical protein
VLVQKKGNNTGGDNKKSQNKCAQFGKTNGGLDQHCKENLLLWHVVSVQNTADIFK